MQSEKSILFICTGNIFRSMTAEYALRVALSETGEGRATATARRRCPTNKRPVPTYRVSSAGTVDAPHDVVPFVHDYLQQRGMDISNHQPTRLTREILRQADLAVAMDTVHRTTIENRFGITTPLFMQTAYDTEQRLPDVDEAIADWQQNEELAKPYCHKLMGSIIDGMPGFIQRIDNFL